MTMPDPSQAPLSRRVRILVLAPFALTGAIFVGAQTGALQQAIAFFSGEKLPVKGEPVPADHGKLSEHNKEWVEKQPPQVQAEFLLGAAVNHQEGATDLIEKLVPDWRGHLHRTKVWQDTEMLALYSSDLRVRAAAIEVNLAVNDLAKDPASAEQLSQRAEQKQSRPWAEWELGMLANRGIQTDIIHQQLKIWTHDPDEQTRLWAVEGLAHIGSSDTIPDFLDVLRNDASHNVRERAGCSLAKSGMLTREQRMQAVPGLIDLASDSSLDETTNHWVYQALGEITDISLPNDPVQWRDWYNHHGSEQSEKFKRDGESVLGNN